MDQLQVVVLAQSDQILETFFFFEVNLIGIAEKLNRGCERRNKEEPHVFGLSNLRMTVSSMELEMTLK